MVRFKERYLLVNILYPEGGPTPKATDKPIPDLLLFNQPTTDYVTPQSLARAIRTQVNTLFGDYGSGAVERTLTFMDHIPGKNGRPCIFRVVRVSGTIRKIEEDAVRRAKQMMLAAKEAADTMTDPASSALGALFGASGQKIDAMELDVDSANEAEDDDAGD
ncbi:hypothetical protein DL546_009658 [Coniochaeta pulveracea]|uniref:Uncharacterized protein n=1 Tax=Coniochaeta pulveracea TaxID=177199 RepID=A0A420YMB6_9PEZI|nr:hypothetical protein DL546_009658 [Coniochaeta pulveracea]